MRSTRAGWIQLIERVLAFHAVAIQVCTGKMAN